MYMRRMAGVIRGDWLAAGKSRDRMLRNKLYYQMTIFLCPGRW